jgi:eukaryotic-like serine/threonine-protein kinase
MNRLMTATCVSLYLLPVSLFAVDSPAFRGGSEHPGVYDAPSHASPMQLKWRFSTHGQVFSSPAISGGTLFVGSMDHFLYAVDLATGTEKWKFETASGIPSSPAVAGGLVFFTSYDGNFYALDVATGKLRWKFKTAGEHRFTAKHLHGSQPVDESMPDPFDVFLSSPLVWRGFVYFGSGDGNIYSLDFSTGTLRWKFQTGDVVHASPAIADGVLFIGSWDSFFYALDATTGKQKWRFKTGEDPVIHNQVGIQASATVADGIVFFGCRDSNLYALDSATGQQKWVFNNKGSWVISSPAVKNGNVYFATSDTSLVYALDAKSGSPIFSLKFQGWPFFSSPTIASNTLYIGSHSGKLIAIDLATQKPAWEFLTDGQRKNGNSYTKSDGSPNYEAAYPGDFYDDMVVGVQRLLTVGGIYGSPVLVDGVLYITSTDGAVYALT